MAFKGFKSKKDSAPQETSPEGSDSFFEQKDGLDPMRKRIRLDLIRRQRDNDERFMIVVDEAELALPAPKWQEAVQTAAGMATTAGFAVGPIRSTGAVEGRRIASITVATPAAAARAAQASATAVAAQQRPAAPGQAQPQRPAAVLQGQPRPRPTAPGQPMHRPGAPLPRAAETALGQPAPRTPAPEQAQR